MSGEKDVVTIAVCVANDKEGVGVVVGFEISHPLHCLVPKPLLLVVVFHLPCMIEICPIYVWQYFADAVCEALSVHLP